MSNLRETVSSLSVVPSMATARKAAQSVGGMAMECRRAAPVHPVVATGLLAALAVGFGCGLDHGSDAADWTLSEGTPIRDLVQSDPIVMVVVDPSQCLRCSSVLAEWLEWERRSGVSVQLLLAREPEEDERRILIATGIRTDGYLTGVYIESQRTPIELVVDTSGIIFRTDRVYGPSSPLLDALKGGRSLREAVEVITEKEPKAQGTSAEEPEYGSGVA